MNTEERKCLCSVFPGGVHSVNNQANQGLNLFSLFVDLTNSLKVQTTHSVNNHHLNHNWARLSQSDVQ